MNSLDTQIAMIGMSGVFPMSPDLDAWWQNLRQGKELITFFTEDELAASGISPDLLRNRHYVKAASMLGESEVKLFDAAFFGYSPREAEMMDPQHRLFLECVWHAFENSGYVAPEFEGRVGVYAGQTVGTYWLNNILPNGDLFDSMAAVHSLAGTAYDFLTTRVSYKLNLRGPSITVQTACSSSLVAVHLACQSLLSGECDMAVAGGVCIAVPQRAGYLYSEGGILSPDGHCRVFDAKALGTVGGSGVGAVVLKRLDLAVEDRDNIRAVIRGSAVNNDGAVKVGFTAPGVDGQTEVVGEALAMAGVRADSISYVEAHGTGTPLGDPTEIASLTRAFQANGTVGSGQCALGAVKSNMGHLDAAAGVAGLIKTVLQLENREIVPTVHYETVNPGIDLPNSPFYVNSELRPWASNGEPRRASVSSFGMGGTNAHVIVEEAPPVPAGDPSRHWHLVLMSAKSDDAVDRLRQQMAAHLSKVADDSIADLAYTSQAGRAAYEYRRAVICDSHTRALSALEGRDPGHIFAGRADRRRPVALLFPGQGTQYAGMGRRLFDSEKVFHDALSHCASILRTHIGCNLLDLLYPSPEQVDNANLLLRQTRFTQPALLAFEYSLARLWMHWGICPEAMVGHSIGEYVAACLAGVLSLEDALMLVATRGRLIQQLPAGAMLAVQMSEREARRIAPDRIDVAAVNSSDLCVISGPVAVIEEAADELRRSGREVRQLRTSHAFHSRMMDSVLDEYAEIVARVNLRAPAIPYVSNVTGKWIRPEEAVDPWYWAKHLRHCVRFADGISEILASADSILLEIGPGNVLSSLARRHPACGRERPVFACVRGAQDSQDDVEIALAALGRLWTIGAEIDWKAFRGEERRRRVPLPGYPFERTAFWIDPPRERSATGKSAAKLSKVSNLSNWFYVPSWRRLPPRVLQKPAEPASVLLFRGNDSLGAAVEAELRAAGHDLLVVTQAESPGGAARYAWLAAELRKAGKAPQYAIHLWTATGDPASADAGFFSLIHLAGSLASAFPGQRTQVAVFTRHLHDVTGDEPVFTEQAALAGPCLVIPQEYPALTCRCVDIGPFSERAPEQIARAVIAEAMAAGGPRFLAMRGGQRWAQTYEPMEIPADSLHLRNRGTYLITGGTGRIGLELARHLAAQCNARLVLVSRSGLSAGRMGAVEDIQAVGGEVMIAQGDVSDAVRMRDIISQATRRFGAVHGVIHAAGALADADLAGINEMTAEAADRQFRVKVGGAMALERALEGIPLDFCVVLSSMSAILGGLSMSAYAAANAMLDSFVHSHNQAGGTRWKTINSDSWNFGTKLVPTGIGSGLLATAMTPAEGIEAFRRALFVSELEQVAISTVNLDAQLERWARPGGDVEKENPETTRTEYARPRLDSAYAAPRNDIDRAILKIWQRFLGVKDIGIHDNFFDLGGHSLMATQVLSRIRETLQSDLPMRGFFEATTIAQLSELVIAHEPAPGWTDQVVRVRAMVESMPEQDVEKALGTRI